VQWRHPLRSTIDLFRNPIYTLGCVVATTSWGFHVAALALAPISVVQAVIAGGLVLVTVLGDRIFGHSVTRREWIGVALTAFGLAFLAATLEGTVDEAHADYDALALYGTIAATTVAAIVLAARGGRSGPALAVSAGLFWAGSDITIKAISNHYDLGLGVLLHPFALIILVWSLVGLLVSARSLQLGPVVAVIALTSATANTLTIAAGPTIFGEPLPEEPGALLIRLAAFALVITAAAMTPPPGGALDEPRERAGEAPA
jgi:multidrug transporter EmrE-like cation transporter